MLKWLEREPEKSADEKLFDQVYNTYFRKFGEFYPFSMFPSETIKESTQRMQRCIDKGQPDRRAVPFEGVTDDGGKIHK